MEFTAKYVAAKDIDADGPIPAAPVRKDDRTELFKGDDLKNCPLEISCLFQEWTNGESRVSTPLGGREFRVIPLTDPTKTPYEDMKIRIVVFQDGHIEADGDANIEAGFGSLKPRCQFDFIGFKDFDADWIDEKIIKIVYWPGSRVRVTELINVESGKIIYRSADGIYDSLKNSLQLKK